MVCRNRLFSVVLLACVVALGGCNSLKMERLNTALDASVKTYRKLVRWGHYDEAAKYFRPRDESVENSDMKRLARYKITSFEVVNQLIADSGSEARVIAVVDFYEVDTGVVKAIKDEQYWWYDEVGKRWYLGSPMLGPLAQAGP